MNLPSTQPLANTVLALLLSVCALATAQEAPAGKQDFSVAERLLFMTAQFKNVRPPLTLTYSFRKSGSLEEGFSDRVGVTLGLQPDGSCCTGKSEFLSGARALPMPDQEGIEANPVTLYFLERDVREMQRLTQGSQNYFRKRIRMAVYNAATVREVTLQYKGRAIKGQEVVIFPFLDDPNRARYDKFVRKQYRFMLSDAVPGGVYGIRSQMNADKGEAAPLIVEELYADGAEPTDRPAKP